LAKKGGGSCTPLQAARGGGAAPRAPRIGQWATAQVHSSFFLSIFLFFFYFSVLFFDNLNKYSNLNLSWVQNLNKI
jgi:hypothetical protein